MKKLEKTSWIKSQVDLQVVPQTYKYFQVHHVERGFLVEGGPDIYISREERKLLCHKVKLLVQETEKISHGAPLNTV